MNIDLQQLLVALFLLVPGFISTEIFKSFSPKKYGTDFQWVVSSLLISIVLNGLLISAFLAFGGYQLGDKLSDFSTQVKEIKLSAVWLYILLLYVFSLCWGVLSGRFQILGLTALLNYFKIISYARNSSVWDRIFDVRRPKKRPITWLKYTIEKEVYFAHLCHSSTHVEMDKPFEVYVDNIYIFKANSWEPLSLSLFSKDVLCDGMYLRITPEIIVELYFAEEKWFPGHIS